LRFTKKGDNFNEELKKQVEDLSDVNLSSCYQCGKCTAGCPMANLMDIKPNQVIRLLNLGQFDMVFNCKAIWDCISCETCTTRCPRELDPASVMDALRMLSKAKNYAGASNNVAKFNWLFLYIIKQLGRLYEPGLVGGYNIYSGDYLKDMTLAPSMLIQGKLKPWHIPSIGDIGDLQKMIDKCEEFAEQERAQKK
jgi:heterodisulfide reductase subunit C2